MLLEGVLLRDYERRHRSSPYCPTNGKTMKESDLQDRSVVIDVRTQLHGRNGNDRL
jgi:hypothetical protein